ncbi:MAG: cold-shock protein [Erythrobacter sp.]|nr:cold-shock protein [Erythrobacter sp.]
MTNYGKIKSYDSSKGAGMIAPEKGGEPMAFAKADLQQQGQMPKVDQRYGYETSRDDDGKMRATNLQQEQGQRDQASQQQG